MAHEWIEARTFAPDLDVDKQFFPRLHTMLTALHSRGIVYIDMSKWENILVGEDGRPYLIDFQVHLQLPRRWPLQYLRRWLEAADLYYLHRHWLRARPDQVGPETRALWEQQPKHVRMVERLGPLWRGVRILLLRLCGVTGVPRKHMGGNGVT